MDRRLAERRRADPGLPLSVALLIALTSWQAPHALAAGLGRSLSSSGHLAAAGILSCVMGLAAWLVWSRGAAPGEKPAVETDNRPAAGRTERDGLRELLPEAEYQRLIASLALTPAADPFDDSILVTAGCDGSEWLSHTLRDALMCVTILDRRGVILSANQRLADATGYSIAELTGRSVLSLAAEGHGDGMRAAIREVSDGSRPGYRAERKLMRRDGSPVWFRSCVTRLVEPGDPREDGRDHAHILVLSEDITAEVAARENLAWQAAHDPLTGLPNRTRLIEALEAAVAGVDNGQGAGFGTESPGTDHSGLERNTQQVALLCLDLNGFKLINETLGHGAGDMLLGQVAERLRGCVGGSDSLARIGGDKFAVIVSGVQGAKAVVTYAERLLAALARPFRVLSGELNLSASLGICLYPADGLPAGEMLQGANVAVSEARRSGPNRYSFFSARLKDEACERLLLGSRLRAALENNEFYVDFQPQYEMARNRLVGFEALCRWRSAALGDIPPARFIPAAEENGMILEIGRFVLREACRCVAAWQTGVYPVRVAVNVSAVQFASRDFVDTVLGIVRENGIEPGLLELELTESTLVRDREDSARKMEELRSCGIRIAIDDFGTGYSSLSYLQSMPVDALKVDRTFTARLGTSAGAATATAESMVRAIIAMARALGLHIVTEGVETEEQAAILRQLGTDDAQGYLYGRPETPRAAAERVRREATASRHAPAANGQPGDSSRDQIRLQSIELSALAGALTETATPLTENEVVS